MTIVPKSKKEACVRFACVCMSREYQNNSGFLVSIFNAIVVLFLVTTSCYFSCLRADVLKFIFSLKINNRIL